MGEPAYHETVFRQRFDAEVGRCFEDARLLGKRLTEDVQVLIQGMALRAYRCGLQDGFLQGVAAEVARRERPEGDGT